MAKSGQWTDVIVVSRRAHHSHQLRVVSVTGAGITALCHHQSSPLSHGDRRMRHDSLSRSVAVQQQVKSKSLDCHRRDRTAPHTCLTHARIADGATGFPVSAATLQTSCIRQMESVCVGLRQAPLLDHSKLDSETSRCVLDATSGKTLPPLTDSLNE